MPKKKDDENEGGGKDRKKEKKKMSRSARLRKYETVYEEFVKKSGAPKKEKREKKEKKENKEKRERVEKIAKKDDKGDKSDKSDKDKNEKSKVRDVSHERKRPLNSYQKFVREESKKSKYKGMQAAERMTAVSTAWHKHKGKK